MTAVMNREQICQFVLGNSSNVIGLVLTDVKEYSNLTIDEDNIKSAVFEEFMSKNLHGHYTTNAEYVFFDSINVYQRFLHMLLDATEEGMTKPFGFDIEIHSSAGLVYTIHT